ncbi:hypothetical protein J5N97_007686 [Dioscorea zingiberensis]|uniref:Uncharacterized protein n=1 Tax=Dioscorea zingiberensis TaxID=325984 RepID=A0A9D5DCX3_9LILI|nr:hypothetical protein J5N97_007686 [Dioscorea zingiberensis]
MKISQDPENTSEVQQSSQASQGSQGNKKNSPGQEDPIAESSSIPIASNEEKKVAREDIELVQNLIERCLQLYMNKGEVIKTLSNRARIEPGFTTLVWQKLEEENSEFFRAYYIRLKLKKQIVLFNHLLERHHNLMRCPVQPRNPLAPIQNRIHPLAVNNLHMGYPVLQQTPMAATGQPHLDPMNYGLSSSHVANEIPAPGSFQPIYMDAGNGGTTEVAPTAPCSTMPSMSETDVGPSSAAFNNHFPFTPSEISGMDIDASTMDSAFATDLVGTGILQLEPDGSSRGSLKSLSQFWNFSFSDLAVDLTNSGDLGALGDYTGSPYLPADSDMLLNSPEQDDIVEEYFADVVTGSYSQSDEQKL